jgi:hypothetical protein
MNAGWRRKLSSACGHNAVRRSAHFASGDRITLSGVATIFMREGRSRDDRVERLYLLANVSTRRQLFPA